MTDFMYGLIVGGLIIGFASVWIVTTILEKYIQKLKKLLEELNNHEP